MRKLLKVLLVAGGLVVVGIVVVLVVVVSNLDKIVKHAVQSVGSDVTGTRVTLNRAEISLKNATGALDGLTIANPDGFASPAAFQLGRIQLTLDPGSIRSDEVVLREIVVDQAHLTFEQRENANNLQTLLDHIDSASAEEPDDGDETTLVIETFRLTGAAVTIIDERLDEPLELTLDDVVLRDIGRVGAGATAADAAKQILQPVLDRTVDAAMDRARDELEQRARDELEQRKDEAIQSLADKLRGNN